MSRLSIFLKEGKKKNETVKIAASRAFVDEDGNPALWEVRPLKSREADAIRKECTTIRKGREVDIDTGKFNAKVAARCTVYPNLMDKELQDSYGVMEPEQLIQEMLDNAGEYQEYIRKIMEVSGFDKSEAELVEEAKN